MFADRAAAGRRLGALLQRWRDRDVVVVGLPRGGVPVAAEVAAALGAPLDVILVRKLGVPAHRELAMGALGEGGVRVLDEAIVRRAGVTEAELAHVERVERAELERRAVQLRGVRPAVPLAGRSVIVVDDGVATGATARAACEVARARGASAVVLAVPVAPADWIERLGASADEYVCVECPRRFGAVGAFYDDFSQLDDSDVIRHLGAR